MKKEFLAVFQITKLIVFEVNYCTLGGNKTPHFTTSTSEFIKSKRDYKVCGQAQDILLPKTSIAYRFWKKWGAKHLQDLTQAEYDEMWNDLQHLKATYNGIFMDLSTIQKPYFPRVPFWSIVELSKRKLKTKDR